MSHIEKEQILKVLSRAIIRETNAFNIYYKESENMELPPGARGLLVRLAEEERIHRQLLVNEYKSIEKDWSGKQGEKGEGHLSYDIPNDPTYSPLETCENLEAAALTIPSRLVGGDNIVTRVIRGPRGKLEGTLLLLYDAMGHGMETTEINAVAARSVGEYIDSSAMSGAERESLSPRKIVEFLNGKIAERYEGEGVFLTALCVYFHAGSGNLTFTCAGHEPPFVIDSEGSVSSLLKTQLIVGIDPEFHYRESTIPFGPGEVFCIFSDGIVEAEDGDGGIFGRDGVSGILAGRNDSAPREIIELLLGGLGRHLGGGPLMDEVSIVVVRAKGG
jgi:serine phosphatase RsbU (regulator of sigma subunit)